MNKSEFIDILKNILNDGNDIDENTVLENLSSWDSLAFLVISEIFNKEFNIILSLNEVKNFKTINDLVKKAGL